MSDERLLLDTAFIQAILNGRDQYHAQARAFLHRMQAASEVWVTEAVLTEVGNALSAFNCMGAVNFIRQCYQTANIRVVSVDTPLVDTPLLDEALSLYQTRPEGMGLDGLHLLCGYAAAESYRRRHR